MTLRVLLVDADADRAGSVRAGLEAAGCSVVAIMPDTVDIVSRVREVAADVIVVDIDDPSRDALESMQALRRDEPRPVAMFVDTDDQAAIAAAMRAGVAAYVIKGLSPVRVKSVLDVAIVRFREHEAMRGELLRARAEVEERKVVERAKGILMTSRGMSEPDAYKALRKMAMDQARRLPDVAESVIAVAHLLKV